MRGLGMPASGSFAAGPGPSPRILRTIGSVSGQSLDALRRIRLEKILPSSRTAESPQPSGPLVESASEVLGEDPLTPRIAVD